MRLFLLSAVVTVCFCLSAAAADADSDPSTAIADLFSVPLPTEDGYVIPDSTPVEGVLPSEPKTPSRATDRDNGRGALFPDIQVRVTAFRHTILSSMAAGRVEALKVRDGDRFAAGELLLAIDPVFESIQLDKAKITLERQRLMYEITKELVDLQSKGEFELGLALVEMKQAETEVAFMAAKLENTRLIAPFPGRVGEVLVREGQYISEGQAALEIFDDSDLELEFIVSSMWLPWFKPGFPFEVTVNETGGKHKAVLERLGGKVDPLSKSIKVYAKLLDPTPDLMEGMSGTAIVVPPSEGRQ